MARVKLLSSPRAAGGGGPPTGDTLLRVPLQRCRLCPARGTLLRMRFKLAVEKG
jgi:hypothetical protein